MLADQPKKRGRKSNAEKAAEAALMAQSQPVEAQAHAAPEIAPEPVFAPPAIRPAHVDLMTFIRSKERDGVVLVEITHPDAEDGGHYPGIYSGIRLKRGPCQALYSDGTTE